MGSPQLGAQQGPPGGMGAGFLEENGRKAIAELFERTFA
jgi:hypothetical protein